MKTTLFLLRQLFSVYIINSQKSKVRMIIEAVSLTKLYYHVYFTTRHSIF